MNLRDFRRIVTAFSDHSGRFRWDLDRVVVPVRDEVIEASVREHEAMVRVRENGHEFPAHSWLIDRIARIPQLADRILASVPEEPFFVPPAGDFLARLDDDPSATPCRLSDALGGMEQALAEPPRDRTTVLYLASDAGQGKSTLLHHAARRQAERYRRRESGFLLLPIHLAGRTFLSFDDIVIAEFVTRLRFPCFYYEAFLELVKLGVLVPLFDGFEEVFAERSAPGPLSQVGYLLDDLDSSGTVVIAARRAFFEFADFENQAKLFDPVGERRVGFSRIRLDRWDRARFVRYADRRGFEEPGDLYEQVRSRLGEEHPGLTRAVLVRRLVEIAERGGVDALLRRLGAERADSLYEVVNALVEREAQEKWVARSDPESPGQSLLSVAEHHTLLTRIAMEMWMVSLDVLPEDILDFVAESFAEARGKGPTATAEIRRRIRYHALLALVPGRRTTYAFDHEDFRDFYLGEALARLLRDPDRESQLFQVFPRGLIPGLAADAAVNALRRRGDDLRAIAERLQRVVANLSPISNVSTNAGAIMMRLPAVRGDAEPARLFRFGFSSEALRGRRIGNAVFEECVFQGTSLDGAVLSGCRFERCTFGRLELPPEFAAGGAVLRECRIACLSHHGEPDGIYDPERIDTALEAAGFVIERSEPAVAKDRGPEDPDARLAERSLRCFLRATEVNEEVFRHRLGKRKRRFFDRVLPKMMEGGVLKEVESAGSGRQRRFALAVSMSRIARAMTTSGHSLDEFLEALVRED